jgi:hypothetical protein
MAPGIVLRNNALVHCSSEHAPPGRLAQYFADGTTLTRRPDVVAFSAFHVASPGYPGPPGMFRHASGDFEVELSSALSERPNKAQRRSRREVVRDFISNSWNEAGGIICCGARAAEQNHDKDQYCMLRSLDKDKPTAQMHYLIVKAFSLKS